MIRKSFIFLEKIGRKGEENIWNSGVKDWNDFLRVDKIKGISVRSKEYYNRKIKEAKEALVNDDSFYFVGKLPAVEMWRLYDYFKEEAGYLDIEVDSLGKVILVGISDYYNSNYFVKGVNLSKGEIERELSKYKLIVTFNGGAFDLPKLRKQMDVVVKVAHLDLKQLCVNLELVGGLKEVEKRLGLGRPAHLYGNPVDLWKAFHASGDREYLDLLIAYNGEDIENLKSIAGFVEGKLKSKLSEIKRNI
ncbi:hypothetical protein HON71_05510 [Candidatus Woesearchaeota archaeon]|jgi:uncharacterized protein|nr:hypothetical protein [Candidatus Woesearchaeota archaeon]MBT5342169.1 hypothetical protein [Candidatus Woesearchaeota archaeon]